MRLSLGGAPFAYAAGQVAQLGRPDQNERVPYSIASAPIETREHGHLEFLLKKEPEGWGPHLAGLRKGSALEVEGPMGSFVLPPLPDGQHVLFVAGGTGIAPLRSMIVQVLRTGGPVRLHLLYSARRPSDFAYLPELRRYARTGRLQLALTATREAQPRWSGAQGRITLEPLSRLVETPKTLCFVCGPASMVEAVPPMLQKLGIERNRIRTEEW